MIEVYQILLSDKEVDKVNAEGWESSPKASAYARVSMGFKYSKWSKEYLKFYTRAYEVATDNLEEAFTLTNVWQDESKIKRLARGTSGSVGNLFVVTEGADRQMYFVDTFGFTKIIN